MTRLMLCPASLRNMMNVEFQIQLVIMNLRVENSKKGQRLIEDLPVSHLVSQGTAGWDKVRHI